jgi:hypothetical protein
MKNLKSGSVLITFVVWATLAVTDVSAQSRGWGRVHGGRAVGTVGRHAVVVHRPYYRPYYRSYAYRPYYRGYAYHPYYRPYRPGFSIGFYSGRGYPYRYGYDGYPYYASWYPYNYPFNYGYVNDYRYAYRPYRWTVVPHYRVGGVWIGGGFHRR